MRNFFSFILISIFGFVFVIGLVAFDLRETFLNTTSIKSVLSENKVYESLVKDTLPKFLSTLEGEEKGKLLFPEELTRDLLTKVLDPQSLRVDVETVIDNLIPYIRGEKEELEVKIDLTKYKKRLTDNLQSSVITYVEGLPTCAKAEEIDTESLPTCKPKGGNATQIASRLPLGEAEASLLKLPNELIIDRSGFKFNPPLNDKTDLPSPQESEGGFDFNNLRTLFRAINFAILATLAFAVLVLLLIFLLWWGKFTSALRWISVALLSASALPALLAALMLAFLQRSTLERFLRFGQEGSPEFLEASYSFLGPFFRHFWTLVLFQTLAAILVATALFVATKFLEKKKEAKA